MIKEKYETKTYMKTEKVLVSEKRYCDVCGKEITDHYWKVTTGHYDWGNDSSDSIKDFDICSIRCLNCKFIEYSGESNKKWSTNYIDVGHRISKEVKGDIKCEYLE